jgi:signal transduction histidine kinase
MPSGNGQHALNSSANHHSAIVPPRVCDKIGIKFSRAAPHMLSFPKRLMPWLSAWLAITLASAFILARVELEVLREAFETDARIAHRLLSQRVVQHDAVLATLALLGSTSQDQRPEVRLPSVYPQVLSVQRRDLDNLWADTHLNQIDAESRRLNRAVMTSVDLKQGRYQILLGTPSVSYLLIIDIRSMVPWSEWPMPPNTSRVRVTLDHADQSFVLQPGDGPKAHATGWLFEFHKKLAAESQPLMVSAQRHVDWTELPWSSVAGSSFLTALVLFGLGTLQQQRQQRRRAEELLRLGQVARLNTLGELAAGMAHELNQPLTAVLANTQAASRLLNDESPDLTTIRLALAQAVAQARRAADVVGRLRRAVERPDLGEHLQPVDLLAVVRKALYLLEPEFHRHLITPLVEAERPTVNVQAEPVALEQIVHNLLMNALQALDTVAPEERRLVLKLDITDTQGRLSVRDSGPGIPADILPRVFEPFLTTRKGGLGLGLSLCDTLASGMGGTLTATNVAPRGAEFQLTLPRASEVTNSS